MKTRIKVNANSLSRTTCSQANLVVVKKQRPDEAVEKSSQDKSS